MTWETWESSSTCDGCGQHTYRMGDAGDVFDGCRYCGWFSEDEDSYEQRLNPEPDVALLVRIINMLRTAERLLQATDTRWYDSPVLDAIRDTHALMIINKSTVYVVEQEDPETGEWHAWAEPYETRTQASEAVNRERDHGYLTDKTRILAADSSVYKAVVPQGGD